MGTRLRRATDFPRAAAGKKFYYNVYIMLRGFAGGEGCSRVSQGLLTLRYYRVRATEHAPRSPRHLHECLYGLAEILERQHFLA